MTKKKNDFKWSPEQQEAFEQMKQEIVHAVAIGLTRTGHVVLNLNFTILGGTNFQSSGESWRLP